MLQDILDYNLLKLNSQINQQWKYSFVVYVQYITLSYNFILPEKSSRWQERKSQYFRFVLQ